MCVFAHETIAFTIQYVCCIPLMPPDDGCVHMEHWYRPLIPINTQHRSGFVSLLIFLFVQQFAGDRAKYNFFEWVFEDSSFRYYNSMQQEFFTNNGENPFIQYLKNFVSFSFYSKTNPYAYVCFNTIK